MIDKKRSAKGGRAVEVLGYINPLTKKNSIEKERVLYWLKVGAKASPRVHNLLVSEKIIDAKKINVSKKPKKKVEATATPIAPTAVPSPAVETPPAPEPVAEVPIATLEPEKPVETPKEEPEKPAVL